MADTAKNIWNDDDGTGEVPKKRHVLRNFLLFALILLAVLGIVLVAAWRDGTGLDVLRRYLAYGSAASGSSQSGYEFDADNSNHFAQVGDGELVILSNTGLRLLGGEGEIWSANVQMSSPALTTGGGLAAAYDVGGTAVYVLDATGLRGSLTAEGPIVSANLSAGGLLTLTVEASGSKSQVSVYDSAMQKIFDFTSRRRYVAEACVTADGKHLAAVTMGQENSEFVSSVVLYDLTREDSIGSYTVRDGLVAAMTGKGEGILTVADTCLTVGSASGTILGNYDYSAEYLREFDLGGEDFAVLLLNRYRSGSVGRLVTVSTTGEEIASLDISEEVRSISACGRYLAVLYADRLVVYNRDLQTYAALHGPSHVREILTRADGSVLMIGQDSATLFLP